MSTTATRTSPRAQTRARTDPRYASYIDGANALRIAEDTVGEEVDVMAPVAPARRARPASTPGRTPARVPEQPGRGVRPARRPTGAMAAPLPASPPLPVALPRASFLLAVVSIVVVGVLGVLVLNTKINEGSFQIGRLRAEQHTLDLSEQQLTQALAERESTGNLQAAATRLGLVPAGDPAFITLPDGQVVGVPQPASESDVTAGAGRCGVPARDGADSPSVVPLRTRGPPRPTESRAARSRIAEARGYHPRGQTVGETPPRGTDAARPALRLVREAGSRSSQPRITQPRAAQPRAAQSRAAQSRVASTAQSRTGRSRAQARLRAAAAARTNAALDGAASPPPPRLPVLADQTRRLRVGTVIVLSLLVVIAGRLMLLQVTDAPAYQQAGLQERLASVDLPAPRGSIVDRDGAVLAGSVPARYIYADPALVVDPARAADQLSPVLGLPRSELLPKLAPHRYADGSAVRFEYLARGVPVEMGGRISALRIAGIGVRRDEGRAVPGHDLAANLIGFTGRDLTGLGGLEASFDRVLRGVDGNRQFEIGQADAGMNLDHEIPGGYHEETPARPGSSLRLTIDQDLQFEVQRVLGAQLKKVRATLGAAIVLDVRTGEVLAQASYPFYDAANPLASRESDRGDVASGVTIDPGSVHKAIVFAACLQEGVVKPGDSVLVPPRVTKGDTTFTDTHTLAKATEMTLPGILALSSNVGTIELADRLGAQKLYEYQRAFGLGEKVGEGLPGESAGLVQPPANWSETSHGSIPIGLGVSATPLQMAAVYAAIANGGVWVRPHLVASVIDPDGASRPASATPTRRVLSPENAAALRTMLEAVVTVPAATGRSARVNGYRVAGKTGTGLLVRDGKYVDGEIASFIGMAPADAPRYVIAVFAHTPGGNGGTVAAPAFAQMMQFTLRHYKVPPTGTKPPTFRVYP